MICKECANAADWNRRQYDRGYDSMVEHPTDCECACGHELPAKWEKQFRVKPPWVVKVQETEVL